MIQVTNGIILVVVNTILRSKRIRWPEDIKLQAKKLRKSGLAYSELVKVLGVSRSTLFSWIGGMKRPGYATEEDRKRHVKRIQKMAVKANRIKKEKHLKEIIKKVKTEIESYPLNEESFQKSLISMLYWSEGAKSPGALVFANTDPKLCYLFITMLRNAYDIDESKFRVRLHLHYYHNVNESKTFWSKLLKIPESKFGKIYVKERSKTKKFRENFAGICFIKYYSEDLRFEVLQVAYQIAGKIAPVA